MIAWTWTKTPGSFFSSDRGDTQQAPLGAPRGEGGRARFVIAHPAPGAPLELPMNDPGPWFPGLGGRGSQVAPRSGAGWPLILLWSPMKRILPEKPGFSQC